MENNTPDARAGLEEGINDWPCFLLTVR